ncbi:MAG TPA: response regulator [Negativicutes bacterium]|nr:response regulator [Negativicutes bacterium]
MLKILLVDDDAGSLRGLALALKMLKHSCDAFCNPLDAWESFKNVSYDVVLTDICMPGLNGIQLGNRIKQLRSDACILYMSGQLSGTVAEKLLNKGKPVCLIRKPIEFNELRAVLNRTIIQDNAEGVKNGSRV